MNRQVYLIDTNVIIGLEDYHLVQPVLAELSNLAAKHKIDVFVHEAARDDVGRDKDQARRKISLSKLRKFQTLSKVKDLDKKALERDFGILPKPNDLVDATLLHALSIGAADFLVTEDAGLHRRARRHSTDLGRRVLFVADAVQLIRTTHEPIDAPARYVTEVPAHAIPLQDNIFDSLREGYEDFDAWWKNKCIKEHRSCWVVEDSGLAGIVVRKDESAVDTDASIKGNKILKICTFKVRPESRGIKLGELLLRKALWFAQFNKYDVVYLTTFEQQAALIDLLEYYGFKHTYSKDDGERVYEKRMSRSKVQVKQGRDVFETDRRNYPRFITTDEVEAFVVPIQEPYHDILYPDLISVGIKRDGEPSEDLDGPKRPGNTIRKVYLCRTPSRLGAPGSLLFFYKGKSKNDPSQAITVVGVLEEVSDATSLEALQRMTGGRSVYSQEDLQDWNASKERPVKVINFLLVGYCDPPIKLAKLNELGVFSGRPPQSVMRLGRKEKKGLLARMNLGFKT